MSLQYACDFKLVEDCFQLSPFSVRVVKLNEGWLRGGLLCVLVDPWQMCRRGDYGTCRVCVLVCMCLLKVYTQLKAFIQLDGYID